VRIWLSGPRILGGPDNANIQAGLGGEERHDASSTREGPPSLRTLATCAWHYAATSGATAVARGRHQPVNLVQAVQAGPRSNSDCKTLIGTRSMPPCSCTRLRLKEVLCLCDDRYRAFAHIRPDFLGPVGEDDARLRLRSNSPARRGRRLRRSPPASNSSFL